MHGHGCMRACACNKACLYSVLYVHAVCLSALVMKDWAYVCRYVHACGSRISACVCVCRVLDLDLYTLPSSHCMLRASPRAYIKILAKSQVYRAHLAKGSYLQSMGFNKLSKGNAKLGFFACLNFSWLFCMFEFFQPVDRSHSQRSEESDAACAI